MNDYFACCYNNVGLDHVDVASSYNNLGAVYRATGELDQDKDYYERALAIREK